MQDIQLRNKRLLDSSFKLWVHNVVMDDLDDAPQLYARNVNQSGQHQPRHLRADCNESLADAQIFFRSVIFFCLLVYLFVGYLQP